jgi:hypothetical protein
MKLIIAGGRDFAQKESMFALLDDLHKAKAIHELVHGHCPTGADHFADLWCALKGVKCTRVPADWMKHGKAAGPIRNQMMVDQHKDAAFLLVFPGGRGTANCVSAAVRSGVSVYLPKDFNERTLNSLKNSQL